MNLRDDYPGPRPLKSWADLARCDLALTETFNRLQGAAGLLRDLSDLVDRTNDKHLPDIKDEPLNQGPPSRYHATWLLEVIQAAWDPRARERTRWRRKSGTPHPILFPFEVFALAAQYWHVYRGMKKRPHDIIYWPAYFVLGHTVELAVTAFLAFMGVPETQLKKYNHNILRLVTDARNRGLKLTVEQRRDVRFVDDIHGEFWARYVKHHAAPIIAVSHLEPVVDCIVEQVRQLKGGIEHRAALREVLTEPRSATSGPADARDSLRVYIAHSWASGGLKLPHLLDPFESHAFSEFSLSNTQTGETAGLRRLPGLCRLYTNS